MYRKVVAVWVSLVILLGLIVIVTDIAPQVTGSVIYVGGINPGNYSTIQEGVDAASPGDTVYVYNGTYYENVWVVKTINLIGENKTTTIINGSGSGQVLEIFASGVNVTNFTTTFGSRGFLLYSSSLCNISNNIMTYHEHGGIRMDECNNNTIINNEIHYNPNGILLDTSDNNDILRNNVSGARFGISILLSTQNDVIGNTASNTEYGIRLSESHGTKVLNNTALNCEQEGLAISFGSSNTAIGNVFSWSNGGNGILLGSTTNNTITNNILIDDFYGIYLYNTTGNNVTSNIIMKNSRGFYLWKSDSNDIFKNKVSDNSAGIYLRDSNYNNFSANTIDKNDGYGIYFEDSSCNNTFHHNNIIENNLQINFDTPDCLDNVWDNGMGEGNFWSDYNGLDDGSGGRVIGDGIGDTEIPHPFTDQGGGYFQLDNYPFIDPIGNFLLLYEGWNLISVPFLQSITSIDSVISSLIGSYDVVQWYNVSDSSDFWKHHHTGKLPQNNDMNFINHTLGFWIHITQPGDTIFLYNGTQPTSNQTIQLYEGWNMVGYPSLTNHNRTVGLNNLEFGLDVDAIQWYDTPTKTWHFMDQDDPFVPGRGYWVHSRVEAGWEVPL
jgi:parallel beta-helix repeat protein